MKRVLFSERVVLPNGVFPATLCLEKGRIEFIILNQKLPEAEDWSQHWIMPGLIDFHLHGFHGFNASKTRDVQEVLTMAKQLKSAGITRFQPATIASENLLETLQVLAQAIEIQSEGAKIAGIYCEGPFYNPAYNGGTPIEYFYCPSLVMAEQMWDASKGKITTLAMSPELAGSDEVLTYFLEKKVLCSMGHSGASYEETQKAISQGYGLATHLFNAMAPLHHREVGIAGAVLLNQNFPAELNGDFHHLSEPMIRLLFQNKPLSSLIMMSDGDTLTGMKPGTYHVQGKEELVCEDGTIQLPDGTIYGSGKSLFEDLWMLIDKLNMPIEKAIQTVTINPARLLGVEQETGSIQSGKRAELILVNEEREVVEVFC